jgi:hypothetical protein
MRHQLVTLCCIAGVLAFIGGCKKSEAPASTTPVSESAAPAKSPSASEAASAPASKDGVLLKVKWPVGARYVYRMDLDQHSTNHIPQMPKPMEQNVTMAMTYALSAIKEIANEGRELQMEFLANEMEVKMGDQVMLSFDSKESGKNAAPNPFTEPFRKMIGSKIGFQVDASGKVDKIIGLEEWQKSLSGDAPGPGGSMLAQQFNEGFFHQLLDYGKAFPDKPVQVGESWPFVIEVPAGPLGKIKVDSKVTFKGLEDHQEHRCAALAMTGTFDIAGGIEAGPMGKMKVENGKASGTSWFDPELGALIEGVSTQTMRMKGQMPGQPAGQAGGFTVEMSQKVSTTLAEIGKVK